MGVFDKEEQELNEVMPSSDSQVWRAKKGSNKIRILAGGSPIAEHWVDTPKGRRPHVCYGVVQGCPYHKSTDKKARVKHLFYILDKSRNDDKIELAELPFTVYREVKNLAENEDWGFGSLPMPYDINITYNPDESPAEMYKVVPSPKREEVSDEIKAEVDSKKSVFDIIKDRKERSKNRFVEEEPTETPSLDEDDDHDIKEGDIPF